MLSLSEYLSELKEIKGLKNDSELARYMHVSRAHISQLRGGHYMGELKCYELALHLGREPLELLSLNRAIRSKDRRLQDYWLEVHRRR
ncbi:MAG: hypothetical protein C0463_08215 [Idiomarina sp.]|nr:hypothetical protein [Idiomarina sp.]